MKQARRRSSIPYHTLALNDDQGRRVIGPIAVRDLAVPIIFPECHVEQATIESVDVDGVRYIMDARYQLLRGWTPRLTIKLA